MARYTGPRSRIARKFGEPIFGPDKYLDRKNFPPGQHGLTKKRKKTSEYGVQLREKQKVKYTYGLLERQFRNFFEKASAASGVTGLVLLQMLESRLDNAPHEAAERRQIGWVGQLLSCRGERLGEICRLGDSHWRWNSTDR